MKLRDMEMLVRVADTASMTVAAQQMHLTPAAVSAAVQRVEDALGVRLFERTTRSLRPTAEGLVVLEGCQDVVGRWERTMEEVRGSKSELVGSVHLSAPADTMYEVLAPLVAALTSEHPKLRVVVDTSDAVQHLHRDAIDMAIRYGPLSDSGLTARRLSNLPRVLVASPQYLSRNGAPESPKALALHRCITLQLSSVPATSWSLSAAGGATQKVPLKSPLCGDGFLARRWALDGMGIAFKNLFDVIDDLESGRLLHVLPNYSGGLVPIHTVFPSHRFLPARVREVDAAITAAFAARSARCLSWLE